MMNKLPDEKRKGQTEGFTLIELLVVIAIIALLVSILVPSLKDAKKLARKAVCASNLHQLSIAIALYSDEYDRYPGARLGEKDGAHFGQGAVHMTLPGQISPKYGPSGLFWCPAEPKMRDGKPNPFWESEGGSIGTRTHGEYVVDDQAWEKNENNERLAWGTRGSCYSVPMSVPDNLPAGMYLLHSPGWSFGGTIDQQSAWDNIQALYMVDGYDIHLYGVEDISDRHKKANYLTFGSNVESVSKEWLEAQADLGEEPWIFEWSHDGH